MGDLTNRVKGLPDACTLPSPRIWVRFVARHGHCRIDREDPVKPSRHLRTQFSHQFCTEAICPCRREGKEAFGDPRDVQERRKQGFGYPHHKHRGKGVEEAEGAVTEGHEAAEGHETTAHHQSRTTVDHDSRTSVTVVGGVQTLVCLHTLMSAHTAHTARGATTKHAAAHRAVATATHAAHTAPRKRRPSVPHIHPGQGKNQGRN
eukprot:37751-Prorocentrum_minimum.AAC.4